MRFIVLLLLLIPFSLSAQNTVAIGNTSSICFSSDSIQINDSLPKSFAKIDAIIIFSNATSSLSKDDVNRILNYVKSGGGLYIGAENWPMQAEGKQLTEVLYNKSHFGNFKAQTAEKTHGDANLSLENIDSIPSGSSTVAFPMDYRLRVEVWVEDQPLILSGTLGLGKIIIDGGYSRFYCNQRNQYTDQLFIEIMKFLKK